MHRYVRPSRRTPSYVWVLILIPAVRWYRRSYLYFTLKKLIKLFLPLLLFQFVGVITVVITVHEHFCAGELDVRVKALAKTEILSTIKSEPDIAVNFNFAQHICQVTFGHFVFKEFRGVFDTFEFKTFTQSVPEICFYFGQTPVLDFWILKSPSAITVSHADSCK